MVMNGAFAYRPSDLNVGYVRGGKRAHGYGCKLLELRSFGFRLPCPLRKPLDRTTLEASWPGRIGQQTQLQTNQHDWLYSLI